MLLDGERKAQGILPIFRNKKKENIHEKPIHLHHDHLQQQH